MKNVKQIMLNKEFTRLIAGNLKIRRDDPDSIIYCGGTRSAMVLYNAIQDIEVGMLRFPPHQRDYCWSEEKTREYAITLSTDSMPPGNLEIYFLLIDGRRIGPFLNDGSQRTRAAQLIYNNPEKFGLTKQDAIYLMRNTSYSTTEKVHRSHQEALKRFQTVNNNLALTPYQKTIGDLIYCNGDKEQEKWQEIVDKIHDILKTNNIRMVKTPYPVEGNVNYYKNLHSKKRHDLSLFLRYISSEKTCIDYRISEDVPLYPSEKDIYFEIHLRDFFQSLGLEEMKKQITVFSNVIELDTSTIEAVWYKSRKNQTRLLNYALYRWLLDVGIWCRNNGATRGDWEEFLIKFFNFTDKGSSAINYINEKNEPDRINVSMSQLPALKKVCTIIKSDFFNKYKNGKPQRNQGDPQLKPGYDNSHQMPFSVFGDGPTFPEPASLNRARGAKEVEKEAT